MDFTPQLLTELFDSFCSTVLRPVYRFGDAAFYRELQRNTNIETQGCNQFIETEDDYKVKLGGYLETHLLPLGFTVHSETPDVYPKKQTTPDLSIILFTLSGN